MTRCSIATVEEQARQTTSETWKVHFVHFHLKGFLHPYTGPLYGVYTIYDNTDINVTSNILSTIVLRVTTRVLNQTTGRKHSWNSQDKSLLKHAYIFTAIKKKGWRAQDIVYYYTYSISRAEDPPAFLKYRNQKPQSKTLDNED